MNNRRYTLDDVLAVAITDAEPEQRRERLLELLGQQEAILAYITVLSRILLVTERRLVSARLQREGFPRPTSTWVVSSYPFEEISDAHLETTGSAVSALIVRYLGSYLRISHPNAPEQLATFGQTLIDEMRRWKRQKEERPANASDLVGRLQQLNDLYRAGALDETEFQLAKRKLLEDLS